MQLKQSPPYLPRTMRSQGIFILVTCQAVNSHKMLTLVISLAQPQALLLDALSILARVGNLLGHALPSMVGAGAASALHQLPALALRIPTTDLALVQITARHIMGHEGGARACSNLWLLQASGTQLACCHACPNMQRRILTGRRSI